MGNFLDRSISRWLSLIALVPLVAFSNAKGAIEESFDTLQIGSHAYTNVTVTSKTKAYIFILHSTGMTNIRVIDLPADIQKKLGYATPEEQAAAKSSWAKKTIAKLEVPQVKGVETQLAQVWKDKITASNLRLPALTTGFFVILGSIVLLFHLFFSYCCLLICQKAGGEPNIIVFVPLLQMIPLFKAAGMSPLWLVALFVPILNFVATILWSIKIVQARNKSGWLALFLLLPVTNIFAFLYLAFSDASAPDERDTAPRVQIMTLETA